MKPEEQQPVATKAPVSRAEPRPASVGLDCAPDVILDVVFDHGLLFVVLANIGDRPAFAVRVKFAATLCGVEGTKRIDQLSVFRRLEFLAPHKSIEVFLDRSESFFARDEPTRLSTAVAWRDREGAAHATKIEHDLEIYRDLGYIERKVPHRAE